ncbi:MAG: hypothetical protein ACI4UT_03945 [Candidatus Enteromonas sp.]
MPPEPSLTTSFKKADFDPYSNSTVAGATLFELQGTADNWNIVSESKNLESSTAKSMKYVTTDAPWKITIGEDAKATILKNSTVGKILYNVSNPRFTTYTSSPNDTMLLPQLYTVAETDNILAFVRDYLRMGDTTMVGAGTGACVADGHYAAAKAALSKLTSEERAAFQNNDEGKYTAALARYRAWAAASGDQTPFDGSATFESKGLSITPGKESASSSNTAIIVTASVLGALSAGSLLFLRKKKQDRE